MVSENIYYKTEGMVRINHIPNILTAGRIVGSVILLLIKPLSFWFYFVYTLCGVSDILDGYIARKTKSSSKFGAALDSVADAVFVGAVLFIFIRILQWPLWVMCWIGIIAFIRILSLTVGFAKFRELSFLHTYANKITGLLLFAFPFLYGVWGFTVTDLILCGAATLSAIEELAINIISKELSRDVRCIFEK